MMDVAKSRGIGIDETRLSALMGTPVIPMVARNGKGKEALMAAAMEIAAGKKEPEPLRIRYGEDVDLVLNDISVLVQQRHFLMDNYPARWVALEIY